MSGFQGRLKEFEALRGLAIILLLALHAEIFDPAVFGEALSDLGKFVASFLLGSFFFLAGYFTEVSLGKPGTTAWKFIWSKFIRIYPPYWLALLLFIFVLGYTLNRSALAVYILNLQAVFSPAFVKPLLTIWYISMLVVFYILQGSILLLTRSSIKLALAAFLVFFVALWLHLSFGFFDPRFFEYYFTFLAGVFFCRFENIQAKMFSWNILVKILLAVSSVLIFQAVLNAEFPATHGVFVLAADFYIFSWILLVLTLFRTRLGDWTGWAWLSTASFFTYLIHRPLWRFIDDTFGLEPGLNTVLFNLIPGAFLALVLGYFLQRGYDRILAGLRLK